MLAQVLHVYKLVVPEQEPALYCDDEHWLLEQDVQVPLAVAEEPFKNCEDEHFGCALQL